ncbi:MAG TPA: recombinase family protein [Candidatus Limnocylindrales bacterium]|nr:recombinase family protein [Candidatus Limnocylindrales bacterium]
MTFTPAFTWAYLRLSYGGKSLAGQLADCTKLATGYGTSITEGNVFRDSDRSATSGVRRERFEALIETLNALPRKHGGLLLAYKQDRLERDSGDLERLMEACDRAGVKVLTGFGEVVVTLGARTPARINSALGRGESENTKVRVRDELAKNAQAGKAHGRESFGWDRHYEFDPRTGKKLRSWETVNTYEADLLNSAARRHLAGETLRSIAADWAAKKVRGRMGAAITRQQLKQLLLRERNVGWRIHHGQVANREAQWPAIMDESLWSQVCALINDRRQPERGRPREALLSGTVLCGVCGAVCRVFTKGATRTAASRKVYQCQAKMCTSRSVIMLDEWVLGQVEDWMCTAEADRVLALAHGHDGAASLAELNRLRAKKATYEDRLFREVIDEEGFGRAMAALRPQIAAAEAAVSAVSGRPSYVDVLEADDRVAAFLELNHERRRAFIRELFDIRVGIVIRRGPGVFCEESVAFATRKDLLAS